MVDQEVATFGAAVDRRRQAEALADWLALQSAGGLPQAGIRRDGVWWVPFAPGPDPAHAPLDRYLRSHPALARLNGPAMLRVQWPVADGAVGGRGLALPYAGTGGELAAVALFCRLAPVTRLPESAALLLTLEPESVAPSSAMPPLFVVSTAERHAQARTWSALAVAPGPQRRPALHAVLDLVHQLAADGCEVAPLLADYLVAGYGPAERAGFLRLLAAAAAADWAPGRLRAWLDRLAGGAEALVAAPAPECEVTSVDPWLWRAAARREVATAERAVA